MNEHSTTIKGVLAASTAVGSAGLSFLQRFDLVQVETWLRLASLIVGLVVGVATAIPHVLRWYGRAKGWFKKVFFKMRFLLLFFSLVLGLGCGCSSLVPSERKASESVKASEAIASSSDQTIRRALSVVPVLAARASEAREQGLRVGQGGQVAGRDLAPLMVREDLEIVSRTGVEAGTKEQARGSTATSLPLGVKIGILAAALGALLLVLQWGWRSVKTTSFGQGLALADDFAARQIRKLRERVALSGNAEEQAKLIHDIAELEAERGRLKAQS